MRPRHRLVRSLDTKDLLSSRDAHIQALRKSIPELDESVTNTIKTRQMQQAEFVAAVYCKCSRHQGVPPGDEVGRHVRAKPSASRLMVSARRPCSFIRVCEVVCIAGDVQDIMTKYNAVHCVDKLAWCETLILSRRWSS